MMSEMNIENERFKMIERYLKSQGELSDILSLSNDVVGVTVIVKNECLASGGESIYICNSDLLVFIYASKFSGLVNL